jgi:glycosidase
LERFAAELLFTLPGTPFVYYGEELGMRGRKPDPELRTPMLWSTAANAGFTTDTARPWHPITGNPQHGSVAAEDADPNSLLSLYKHLVRVRERSPALRHGRAQAFPCDDRKLYVAFRDTDHDAVLILANFDDAARSCPRLSIAGTAIRPTWSFREEIASKAITPPSVSALGAWEDWQPLAELPPHALYVIHWVAP